MENSKLILVTGGSGLIGSALTRSLVQDGHSVIILTRRPDQVAARFDNGVTAVSSLEQIPQQQTIHQVVNLAGEQIVGKRWTSERKKKIRQSRIDLTRSLVQFLGNRETPPEVLISGSAVGYYGDRGDMAIDEATPPATDFGARLCEEWEAEAEVATTLGIRVCLVRTGLVLSTSGGMLQQMLLPFKLGLGARLGDGSQWMSWIHIDDEVGGIRHLLRDPGADGPFNFGSPNPVTNKVFTESLASALHRPALLAAPGFVIRLGFGEAADLLLGGQKALPAKLESTGYRFKFPDLKEALRSLLH